MRTVPLRGKRYRGRGPLRDRVLIRLLIQPDGCLIWQGWCTADGYGKARGGGKNHYVHRLMYEWFVGPIPPGAEIDHLCRVRNCASPAHLEAVSHVENLRRGNSGAGINARKTHCLRGHPFDESNIYWTPSRPGTRNCKICKDERNRS